MTWKDYASTLDYEDIILDFCSEQDIYLPCAFANNEYRAIATAGQSQFSAIREKPALTQGIGERSV